MAEETYTLDEAKRVLAEQECRDHGHDWDVIEVRTFADPAGTPRAVVCSRCEAAYSVNVGDRWQGPRA